MVRKCYNGVFMEKQLRKTYHLITLVFFFIYGSEAPYYKVHKPDSNLGH